MVIFGAFWNAKSTTANIFLAMGPSHENELLSKQYESMPPPVVDTLSRKPLRQNGDGRGDEVREDTNGG